MGVKMITKKSKVATKKKAIKTDKVQGISKVSKKAKAESGKTEAKDVKVGSKKQTTKISKVQNANKKIDNMEMDSESRKFQDVIIMAENIGIEVVDLIKTTLIRAIQRAEGSNECYRSEEVLACGQMDCLWREDCTQF
jgi:hypothetical protein